VCDLFVLAYLLLVSFNIISIIYLINDFIPSRLSRQQQSICEQFLAIRQILQGIAAEVNMDSAMLEARRVTASFLV
jgi:hypothetical protein